MPVRSLTSSVFVWPGREQVDEAVRVWATEMVRRHSGVHRIGYFGSYARGDWGVGSDVDLVVIIGHTPEPFERRALCWDLSDLPVPAELLIYTLEEWQILCEETGRFARMLSREVVWVYPD